MSITSACSLVLGKNSSQYGQIQPGAKGSDRWCLLQSVVSGFTHCVWSTVLPPPQFWAHTQKHTLTPRAHTFLSSNLVSIHNKDLCKHILVLNVWQEFNHSGTISQLVNDLHWLRESRERSAEAVSAKWICRSPLWLWFPGLDVHWLYYIFVSVTCEVSMAQSAPRSKTQGRILGNL